MASIFVSHSSDDSVEAELIAARLRDAGYVSLFLDVDAEQGISPGQVWERKLYFELRRADAVLFLGSPASVASPWCFAELALARSRGLPVFPLLIKGDVRHQLLGDIQWTDFRGNADAAFGRLRRSLEVHGLDPSDAFDWDPRRPPYPGLESFSEEDAAVFFGRTREVKKLLELLQPMLQHDAGRVIAVVGPSSSGKSSLVRAGLLPRLRKMGDRWVIVPPFVPDEWPTRNLARQLARAFQARGKAMDAIELRERLQQEGSPALVTMAEDLCDASHGDPRFVLLVVDQAEELLTRSGAEERAAFLGLLDSATEGGTPLWVVLTIRSEFLNASVEHGGLAAIIDESLMLGAIVRSSLAEVITRPADRAGLVLQPGLVDRMVEETGGGDAIPLLAYTLRRLFDRAGASARVTIADYDDIGGVGGSLQIQADKVADVLQRRGLGELIQTTLTKLSDVNQDGEPTRRRVRRKLLSNGENEIVQAYIDARLLQSDGVEDEATVAVAHEALLRQWTPLRLAIDARRRELHMRSELERLALDWDRAGRRESYLLAGDRLQAAQQWASSYRGVESELPLVWAFLDQSMKQDLASLRRESELLANRVLAGFEDDPELGILLALAAIEEYAPAPRAILALNTAMAASRVRVVLNDDIDPDCVAWSPDGTRIAAGCSYDGTTRILNAVTGAEEVVLRGHRGAVRNVAWSPDGDRLLTASLDGSARVWDTETSSQLLVIDTEDGIYGAAWSSDGSRIATALVLSTRIWDAVTGGPLLHLEGEEAELEDVAWSPDGTLIATTSLSLFGEDIEPAATIWNAVTGESVLTLRNRAGRMHTVDWNPSPGVRANTWLVTASSTGAATIWDIKQAEFRRVAGEQNVVTVLHHPDEAFCARWSPEGERVVTAGPSDARIWSVIGPDFGSQRLVLPDPAGADTSRAADWSPDGTRVVTSSIRGSRIWDVRDELPTLVLQGHQDEVGTVGWSRDGTRIATASADGTRIWDAATGAEVLVIAQPTDPYEHNLAHVIALSPDGSRLVTGSANGTTHVWDATAGVEVLRITSDSDRYDPIQVVAWSPDGSTIAAGRTSGTTWIWDAATGANLATLRGTDRPVRSIAWSPAGDGLATAGEDGIISVWDVAEGVARVQLGDPDRPSGSAIVVAWSPDGTRVLTAADDEAIEWHAGSGEALRVIPLPSARSHHIAAWSPDGQRIAAGGSVAMPRTWTSVAGSIVVFDAATGDELQSLVGHDNEIKAVAWSPDAARVVTVAAENNKAYVWDVPPLDRLVALARTRVFRQLTDEERRRFGLPEKPAEPSDTK